MKHEQIRSVNLATTPIQHITTVVLPDGMRTTLISNRFYKEVTVTKSNQLIPKKKEKTN